MSRLTIHAKDLLNRAAAAGRHLLFPPSCVYCRHLLPEPAAPPWLCLDCVRRLVPPSREVCPGCGLALPAVPGARCPACADRQFRFDALVALGDYEGELRRAVLRMKRAIQEPLSAALGQLLAQQRGAEIASLRPDVVLPVPMHWLRRILRGTNSPEIVASQLAAGVRRPMSPLLIRRRYTQSQGNLTPTRRAANVRNAFRLQHPQDFAGARVLLVDDVVTSGATCNEAARLLKRAGAAFVGVAAICRTQSP